MRDLNVIQAAAAERARDLRDLRKREVLAEAQIALTEAHLHYIEQRIRFYRLRQVTGADK